MEARERKLSYVLGCAGGCLVLLGLGAYFHQYVASFVAATWLAAEVFGFRFPGLDFSRKESEGKGRLTHLSSLLSLYARSDAASETLLYEKISELRIEGALNESEERWLERLKDLMQLRGLVFGGTLSGKKGLRQAFAYSVDNVNREPGKILTLGEDIELQDITASAIVVADLYWKLYDTARGSHADLTKMARRLYAAIFKTEFQVEESHLVIERLADSMQRDSGIPFLILSLIKKGEHEVARKIAQGLLTLGVELDEDIRSSIYWVSEVYWFSHDKSPITDYESTIRYLYHLCFTNPDRAGFLEIDSQFFSQFETVSELAREGFLFKESLLERMLMLWEEHEGLFDGVFREVLEQMTQRKSKIYDELENWERFWKREGENFSRDYLYLVEGNIAYSNGYYEDAAAYYEKALAINPGLRPALLNLPFPYAKLKQSSPHEQAVERALADTSLLPSALYVAGNSYLLLGNVRQAEVYFEQLKAHQGWERKIEYYKSTFCYENGLFERALEYARKAHAQSPEDSRIAYHLSVCYNALGEKDQALAMVKGVGNPEAPEWMNYYRFTLERDAGRHEEASETLLRIPVEYFQDPEELQAALEFARGQKDLVLLRHLRRRKSS